MSNCETREREALRLVRAYPLTLALPGGVRAQLVIGSAATGVPCYEIDGVPINVDVRIPDDLADTWYWHGSFLTMRTEPKTCGLAIDTGTYPPPGWPAPRGSCFDSARVIDRLNREFAAKRRPTQLTMELA